LFYYHYKIKIRLHNEYIHVRNNQLNSDSHSRLMAAASVRFRTLTPVKTWHRQSVLPIHFPAPFWWLFRPRSRPFKGSAQWRLIQICNALAQTQIGSSLSIPSNIIPIEFLNQPILTSQKKDSAHLQFYCYSYISLLQANSFTNISPKIRLTSTTVAAEKHCN